MKTSKFYRVNWLLAALPCALAGWVVTAGAATATWSGGAGDLWWSSALNWDINAPPSAADSAVFGNGGATNLAGAVNNILASSLTVSNLAYSALANNGFYHTTLIQPGQTLTLDSISTNSIERLLNVEGQVGTDDQIYAQILGPRASLVLGNTAAPKNNYTLYVSAKSANAGQHRATLDLSGLDNFTFAGGFIGVAGDGGTAAANRPAGTLLLARTNLIICNRTASSAGTIRISHNETGNDTGAAENVMELGQENSIYTIFLRVGGQKALNGGALRFRSGLVNPVLRLRGTNGVEALPLLTIGDNWNTATGVKSVGVVDLSGGVVDGLIDTLHVARTFANGGSTTSSGSGEGTLTLRAGSLSVSNLFLGCQGRNNLGTGTGVINAGGSALLDVGTLNIGGDAGTQLGTGIGTLNIEGGTVRVLGNIVENDASAASGCDGSSTINLSGGGVLDLQPPGDPVAGNVTVDTLNFSNGIITNYSTLGLSALNVLAPAAAFWVYEGQSLSAVGSGTNPVGTLTVNGNLVLSNATLRCDLDNNLAGDVVGVLGNLTLAGSNRLDIIPVNGALGMGDYLLMTYGGLAGDASNLYITGLLPTTRYTFAINTSPSVVLTVGGLQPGSVSLTWAGDGAANLWDLTNSVNWNANTEKFYSLDPVRFDDTSSQTNVTLASALTPAGVTVNSTNDYIFGGAGGITGSGGLTNLGPGSLWLQTMNDYTGTTLVNAGRLVVGDGGTNGNVTGPIINNSVVVFNRSDELLYAGVISGSGSLIQAGSGGLRLHTPATYTGPTAVESGWLRISGGNNRLPTGTVLTLGSAGAAGKVYLGITTAARSQQLAGLVSAGLGGAVVNGAPLDTNASVLTLNVTGDFVFAGRLGGDGPNENNLSLVKSGTGKQTLSGATTYTETTSITGGTLALSGSGSIASSQVIAVNSGARFDVSEVTGGFKVSAGQTLTGSGTVTGAVTVASGGILSPGSGLGTLTVNADLTLAPGSTNLVEVNTDTLAHDLVTGLNRVTYGGTLLISPSGTGSAITNGASLKLFGAATYSGAFGAVVPAVPGPGLVWDTSSLTVDGTVKVALGVSTVPTSLTFAVSGGELEISWPADHQGWRLECQTNALSIGLSNNWTTVAGSTATNRVTQSLAPANGSTFYRLVYP